MAGLARVLLLSMAVSMDPVAEIQTAQPSKEAGYVVEAADNVWEAVPLQGAARHLKRGDGIMPGDTVQLRSGVSSPTDAFIGVLLFSTGRIVKLGPGAKVDDTGRTLKPGPGVKQDDAGPPKPGMLGRLYDAMRTRLSNETLVPGIVRSGGLVQDSVALSKGAVEWRTVAPGLTAGTYNARFRPLGLDGRPAGAWTPSEPFEVTANGITPVSSGSPLKPGLWQVAISHQRVPTVSGDAWILITLDPAAKEAFDVLTLAIADSLRTEGLDIDRAALRAKRAALLALAEGIPSK